jgi:biopolymer transport protein ExbD
MSHGGGSGGGQAEEPNLTPLLDMVLQLVMFFMMVANFTMEQVNEDVKLPLAQSARPPDKSEVDVVYLNLNGEGKVMVTGRNEPLNSMAEVKYYLQTSFKEAQDAAKARNDNSGQVKTVVIIRADQNADFAPVFNILRECKAVGFSKWQLRATIDKKG